MTAVTAEKLVAVQNQHGVEVQFLGSLLWYTIVDCRITKETLTELFTGIGLDSTYLPNDINPRDAFRRASKKMESLRRMDLGHGQYLNILVREVKMTRTKLTRQMVREIVDSKNKRLEYTPVAELVHHYNRTAGTDRLDINELEPLLEQEGQAISLLPYEYEANKLNYNGNNIREVVARILADCDPVSVRPSGGVYFVPQEHEATIQRLQQFVKELAPFAVNGTRSSMHTVPVVDAEEQREMVRESLEAQVEKEAEALIKEMTEVIRDGRKVSTRLAAGFADRARKLSATIKQYETTLEEKQIGARANLEVVLKQATTLFGLVEA